MSKDIQVRARGRSQGGLCHAVRSLPKAYRSLDDDPSDQDKGLGPIETPRPTQILTQITFPDEPFSIFVGFQ